MFVHTAATEDVKITILMFMDKDFNMYVQHLIESMGYTCTLSKKELTDSQLLTVGIRDHFDSWKSKMLPYQSHVLVWDSMYGQAVKTVMLHTTLEECSVRL